MKKYDVLVVGGGFSGVAAAISAARLNKSVLLCEASGALGGAMNNCLVYPFMTYWTVDENGNKKYLSAGIFAEMLEKLDRAGGKISEKQFKNEIFKCVLDEMCGEAGVDVLFHAKLMAAKTSDKKVVSADFAAKSGIITVEADSFVDATGDGDLFAFAGCDFSLGRPQDNLCQPMTTCFRMCNVDIAEFKVKKPEIQALYKQYKSEGKITNPREDILTFLLLGEGIVHFNTTRVVKLNPVDPFEVSRAEMIARKQVIEMVDFLKSNFDCFKNAELVSVAAEIGVRESRMLKGEYVLCADEIMACTKFEDGIALSNYDIDIHNPEGSGTSHYYFGPGQYYSIPYRCLVPREFDNLFVCGRCISASHEAQASLRIMPICATTGQAAGTAAALMLNENKTNKTLDTDYLRQTLRDFGAAVD